MKFIGATNSTLQAVYEGRGRSSYMETLITIHLQEEINEEMLIEKVEEEYQVLGVAAVTKIKREDSCCKDIRQVSWVEHIKKLLDMCV